MRYLGGKHKIAKHFLPLILAGRKSDQYFVEPFSGGCNVTTKVVGPRMANDMNHYLIAMFKAVVRGWLPPTYVSAGDYYAIKSSPENYPPELVGFVGVACSFGGKFLDVYARSSRGHAMRKTTHNVKGRSSYAQEQFNVMQSVKPLLKDVVFTSIDYRAMVIPPGSIVYCDPPYVGTSGYKGTGDFDSVAFWAWVRNASMYNRVYVSEFKAPKDFKVFWKRDRIDNLNAVNSRQNIVSEKIFVWKHSPYIK